MALLAGLFATAVLLAGCSVKYPVVGAFDDYNEVFIGEVDHNLVSGTASIQVEGKNSGLQCKGNSRVLHIPLSNIIAGSFLIPYCTGQEGIAILSCSDGSAIEATWTAESCTSGYGHGYDQNGARFNFAFGLSEEEAFQRFKEDEAEVANLPEYPVYRPKEKREELGFSTGTGFLVSETGYLMTNYHVIEDAEEISIKTASGELPVTVVATDEANDVALVRAPISGTPLPLSRGDDLVVADEVMALGYPLVMLQGQTLKATFGRVNALSGILDHPRYIQIDVPIQPGNSGGPLVDETGRVVGIVTMTLDDLVTLGVVGTLPQNVNYAVKSKYIVDLVSDFEISSSNSGQDSEFRDLVARYRDSVFLVIAR